MEPALQAFLSQYQPQAEEITVWGGGKYQFHVVSYFGDTLPPQEFVTTVRGIVTDGQRVLVLQNRDEVHIVPGGRREKGEHFTDTLRREVLEESGWLTEDYSLLGWWHFHHLTPRPPDYPYLYPDFLQLIYRAKPSRHLPEAELADDYEQSSWFATVEEVNTLTLQQPSQLKFLARAVAQD